LGFPNKGGIMLIHVFSGQEAIGYAETILDLCIAKENNSELAKLRQELTPAKAACVIRANQTAQDMLKMRNGCRTAVDVGEGKLYYIGDWND